MDTNNSNTLLASILKECEQLGSKCKRTKVNLYRRKNDEANFHKIRNLIPNIVFLVIKDKEYLEHGNVIMKMIEGYTGPFADELQKQAIPLQQALAASQAPPPKDSNKSDSTDQKDQGKNSDSTGQKDQGKNSFKDILSKGIGDEWIFKIFGVISAILAFLVNVFRYNYNLGFYQNFYNLPLAYIDNPIESGLSYYVIGVIAVTALLLILLYRIALHFQNTKMGMLKYVLTCAFFPFVIYFLLDIIIKTTIVLDYYINMILFLTSTITVLLTIFILFIDAYRQRNNDKTDNKDHDKKSIRRMIVLFVVLIFLILSMGIWSPQCEGEKAAEKQHEFTFVLTPLEYQEQLKQIQNTYKLTLNNHRCYKIEKDNWYTEVSISKESPIVGSHLLLVYRTKDTAIAVPFGIVNGNIRLYTNYHIVFDSKDIVSFTVDLQTQNQTDGDTCSCTETSPPETAPPSETTSPTTCDCSRCAPALG